ncbi:MAG: serine protease Do [Chloroflexota bacterium]|nr:serine protease Do [Chloroflexota bacterium]
MKKIAISLVGLVVIASLAACTAATTVNLPDSTATETSPAVESQAPTSAPADTQAMLAAPSLEGLQAAYESVYDAVLPSVVSIEVTSTVTQSMPAMPEIPFDFGLPNDGSQNNNPQQYQESAAGSGFVWDTEGHIVTNNHVVENADTIRVTFADGTSVPATLVGNDASSDLAVIQIDLPASELTPIKVADSTQAKVGQLVVAIGNPYRLSSSMTTGIVSGLGRSLSLESTSSSTYTIPDVIQTDAAINPGNSGGVLVDIQGRLLGVTSAIESPVRANSGVGYVIPSIIVQKIVPFLIQDGFYQQPYIGISGTDLVPELAEAMNLDATQRGALVIDVSSGTPAESAGLQGSDRTATINGQDARVGGDVITAVDGNAINDFEDLTAYLARYTNVGQTIEITYLRNGQEATTSLTLAARPGTESRSAAQSNQAASNAWLGVTGVDMSDVIASAMDLNPAPEGVLVEQIASGSPADKAGLRGSYKPLDDNGEQILVGGDIITAVDDTAINGVNQLASAIASYQPGDEVSLTILRSGKQTTVTVTLAEKP